MTSPYRIRPPAHTEIIDRLHRTLERWPDRLNPQEYTALRRKLLRLRTDEQFDCLAEVFSTPASNAYLAQEYAGRLLVDLRPECEHHLGDVLRTLLPHWNRSIEHLPLYLQATFGRDTVLRALEELDGLAQVRREQTDTVRFWLRSAAPGGDAG